jgi:Domain of unknown function (DUF6468)
MTEWLGSALDILLILMIGAGLVQVSRLIGHLAGLKKSRAEMERFVHEFGATVMRAEAGIKALKQAARESGDDLEKLVERSTMIRDELTFIVESADQLAERLSVAATSAQRHEPKVEKKSSEKKPELPPDEPAMAPPAVTPITNRKQDTPQPSSRAEKELLQALQKLK